MQDDEKENPIGLKRLPWNECKLIVGNRNLALPERRSLSTSHGPQRVRQAHFRKK
jgi:hypothetical protein